MGKAMTRTELREYYRKQGCPKCADAIINMVDLIKKYDLEWMYK